MMKTDWQTFEDVRRSAGHEVYHTPEETDCRVSANVGDLMAAAMAAAGSFALCLGGRTACETDYLAARGAQFPATVTRAQMERFNHVTYLLPDDVASEVRYKAMSAFWHLESFDERMDEIARMMA